MSFKFKRLDPNAQLPARAYPTDTGYDVIAVSQKIYRDQGYVEYGLGLAVELPFGWGLQCRARSSISKYDLMLCNGLGTIDNEYRGEIKLRFKIVPSEYSEANGYRFYIVGDKIAQLVPERVLDANIEWVEELSPSMRDTNGFGSTGR